LSHETCQKCAGEAAQSGACRFAAITVRLETVRAGGIVGDISHLDALRFACAATVIETEREKICDHRTQGERITALGAPAHSARSAMLIMSYR